MKKSATYTPHELQYIAVGSSARVFGVDHHSPDMRGTHVHTSPVLNHDTDTGVFETLNTIYTPVQPTS